MKNGLSLPVLAMVIGFSGNVAFAQDKVLTVSVDGDFKRSNMR